MANRKTNKQFKNEIFNLVGNEYEVLSEYINTNTKIKMKHNKCKNEYLTTPNNFLSGSRCKHCSLKRKNIEEIKEEVFETTNGEYSVISNDNPNNNKEKVLFKHNQCNNTFETRVNNFLSKKTRCPYCSGNMKKDTNIFKNEVYNLVKDEYTVIGEYKSSHEKIKMKHNLCGSEYKVTPYDFTKDFGNRCPICNKKRISSKGELKIKNYLDNNNIDYIREYKFKNCKNKKELPFDFFIPSLNTCIEFDSIQHFEESKQFLDRSLDDQKIRDNIKNNFCHENKIKLIRISYLEIKNIDKILKKELSSTTIETNNKYNS